MACLTGRAQQPVRIMHYNLLQYGNPCDNVPLSSKDVWLESILTYYKPDILTVNEMAPNVAFANRILQKSITFSNNFAFGKLSNQANSSLANMIFYNKAIFGYAGDAVIGSNLRDINVYKLYYLKPQTPGDTTFLYCIIAHFKAGSSASDENRREEDAQRVMDWIGANARGENVIFMGDLNISGHTDKAFQKLVFHPDAEIRLRDPSGAQNGWGNNRREVLTQSTRSSSPDCGSGGGLDDRFDFILPGRTIMEGSMGAAYTPGTYKALGNDGSVFNTSLNCNGNTAVPDAICNNLRQMSDHLPVVMELSLDMVPLEPRLQAWLQLEVPNPIGEAISLRFGADSPARLLAISLLDVQGKLLMSRRIYAGAGAAYRLPVSLPAGMYVLQISDEQGHFFSKKLIRF